MRGSRCFVVAGIAFLCLSFAVVDARGQAVDWVSESIGMSVPRNPDSPRLDGMGGLRNVIPDEGRELNLSDYGGMLSGVLYDSDGRRWEAWTRSIDRKSDRFSADGIRNRVRTDGLEAGGRITWRAKGKQFLGLEYAYDELSREYEHAGDGKIRSPWWGVIAGRAVGRFTMSAGIHLVSDNEDVVTDNVFAIRHQSSGMEYLGSLAYRTDQIEVGLQAEHEVNTITGISRDESRFHEDELTWRRPIKTYTGALLWRPTEWLKGIVRVGVVQIDGREEAEISWSDRMPQNPGRENFRTLVGTFKEETRGHDVGTRWELRPFDALLLAGEFLRSSFEDEVEEGRTFKGSRRSQHSKERVTHAYGGAGYETAGQRLRVGVEGGVRRQVDEQVLLGGDTETTLRELTVRAGIEYFVTDLIALRGGYFRGAWDADLDAPRTLHLGSGMSLGLGYLPRGGLIQLDAAIRMQDYKPDYEGDPRFKESRMIFSFGARFLL